MAANNNRNTLIIKYFLGYIGGEWVACSLLRNFADLGSQDDVHQALSRCASPGGSTLSMEDLHNFAYFNGRKIK